MSRNTIILVYTYKHIYRRMSFSFVAVGSCRTYAAVSHVHRFNPQVTDRLKIKLETKDY